MLHRQYRALFVQRGHIHLLWLCRLEVVTGKTRAGRLELAHGGPLRDAVFFDGATVVPERELSCAIDGFGIGRIIGQTQLMAVGLMFVVVMPAGLFPATMQHIAVALVELEHLGAHRVAMPQLAIPVRGFPAGLAVGHVSPSAGGWFPVESGGRSCWPVSGKRRWLHEACTKSVEMLREMLRFPQGEGSR
jgi:hypothetical protein